MPDQAEILKSVRQKFTAINTDARKALDQFVRQGRTSQRDLSKQIDKARTYVDTTSRDSVAAVAENLRKVASRLDRVAHKVAQ